MKSERRIRILPENEIDDLFSRPIFSEEERLVWFELTQDEHLLLVPKKSLASKVDLILQLGYFKAKHQFFNFAFENVKEDISYILNRYFPNKVLEKSKIGRETKRLNQCCVINHFGYTLFNAPIHIPMLLKKSHGLCQISNDPIFVFRGLFDALKSNKITIPGYTTFQEHVISVAIHNENERLYSGLSLNMSILEREALLTLLDQSDDCYTVTCLKQHPKNFKLNSIRSEIERFEKILPCAHVALRILPVLNLSKTSIQYYASLVDHYTVQGLMRVNENQTCLWLLCFVYQRYRLMIDNLTTMLSYTCNQYVADVKEKTHELYFIELQKPNEQNWKIAKTLRFFRDPKTGVKRFSAIKKDVHVFFETAKMDQTIDRLEDNDKVQKELKNKCHWLAVDALAATFKQPIRLLIKTLHLNGDQHLNLQKACTFLRHKLDNDIPLSKVDFDQFPLQFISAENAKFIYNKDNKTIHTNRFEYECYHRIAAAIDHSTLFITDSTHYGSLNDELKPNWSIKKTSVIQNLKNTFLNQGVAHFIETHVKPLDQKIKDINEAITDGDNLYVKVKKDKEGSTFWTLPYTRKNEKIDNPFYGNIPSISIIQLLQIVNEQTGFLNAFTHIKPHYSKSKRDEMSIYATLVANGTNMGIGKMERLCDLNFNDLNSADKNHIRLSTLREANDLISNAISKLPIFKCWNLLDNLLLASADGQKMLTERETLLARYALKYFGLEKGVVAYSLIANHVPINCSLIGANMHESHHLFDLFYNNTSLIKPDVLSTDTEGANQLNFLLLHTIDKLFAPRYRSLSAKTQSIISCGELAQFNDLLIKPNRVFNEKLVRDEEDNIQHIIASLLSGDTNQSTIVRKLSSAGYKSRTKEALWEMNAALMTEHLLTYINDVNFRQAIQGGLCRGEAYHQLRRTIEKINGKHFRGTSDIQMATWNECARLLANCVIYYNAVILNELKEESDSRGYVERSHKLIRFSPAGWSHINFQGRYIFMDNSIAYDLKNEIKNLFNVSLL
jgi:TnpA family transposase